METNAEIINKEINSCRLLFAPKMEDVTSVLALAIKNKEEELFCFSNHPSHIYKAMDYIIGIFHETNSGRITTGMLYDAIEAFAKMYDMADDFSRLKISDEKNIVCTSDEKNLIAIGTLDIDYADGDSDCYETPGGYRSYIAKAGTKVKYYLNSNLSVVAKFESSCLVDHYNNNIAGVSTGGGTTTYKEGESVKTRSVTMGREWNYWEWNKPSFKATVKKIDVQKAKNLCAELQPELAFMFSK